MSKKRLTTIILIVAAAIAIAILSDALLANHQPVIASLEAEPERVTPLGSCQIVCTASDSDGDELSYNWSASEGSIAGTGPEVTWTAPRFEGSYNVTVTVTDGRGGEISHYILIQVRNNRPPTIASLVADVDWTQPSGSIQLTCTASDPDGDALNYEWSADGGDISGSGEVVSWTAPQEVGIYHVTVIVKDNHGREDVKSVSVSVATSAPPVIEDLIVTADHKYLKENGADYDYKVGKEQEYNIECTLSNTSSAVSYNWSCEDGEISDISGDGSMITWTAPNTSSKVTITVIVSDVTGNKVSKSVVLYVVSCSPCTFG
jgi:hypothetical protein